MLPCNFSTGCNERRESALIQLERLKELLSCLDHHRYLTLARLFYHLHRYMYMHTYMYIIRIYTYAHGK